MSKHDPWQPGDETTCQCGKLIRLAAIAIPRWGLPDIPPYWYHVLTSTIWCDGWGDPQETGRRAEPAEPPIERLTAEELHGG